MTMHGASSCERPAHSFPEPESVFLLSKRSGMHFAKNKFPPPRLRPVSSEPGQTSCFCFGQEASPFLEATHHPPGQQRPPPMTAAPCLGPAPPGSGTGHHGSSAVGKLFFFFFFSEVDVMFLSGVGYKWKFPYSPVQQKLQAFGFIITLSSH